MKLTHPCKDTCSGYSQDCAEQIATLQARVTELLESKQHEFQCFQKVNSELTGARLEIATLLAEIAVARERLGPAGYKVIQEVAALRKVVDAARSISAFREEPYPGIYTSVLTSEAKTLWDALRELDGEKK